MFDEVWYNGNSCSLRGGLVWLTRPFPRFGGSWCRQLLGGREREGLEVATRGKVAADFKPARPQLNSNWVRSRNKKDWSSDAALDFKQSNVAQTLLLPGKI